MYTLLSTALTGASLIASALAAPAYSAVPSYTKQSDASATAFPLADGFPAPSTDQLRAIELLAHGTLPNGAPPPPGSISQDGITNLQLIQFNENFEVAFFSSLLFNVTTNVTGFEIADKVERDFVLEVLIAVLAQEELHATNAGNGLKSQNQPPILPCKYTFPTTTFPDAIALAATFTDVVLGTLQDVIEIFAINNDNGLTRGVAAVVGQEGEQEGFYRLLQQKQSNKIPSAQPFLTTSTRDFAFSALQGFVVKGSCPNQHLINLDVFAPLNVLTKSIAPQDQVLQFSFDLATLSAASAAYPSAAAAAPPAWTTSYVSPSTSSISAAHSKRSIPPPTPSAPSSSPSWSSYDYSQLVLVYINQQNTPISVPLQNAQRTGSVVTFEASFPFERELLFGLTLAAVARGDGAGAGAFANAEAVAAAAVFGPGLIEVD